jgi:putative membrane protein
MQISDEDRERLARRVAVLEARTGAQVVTALVARSDAYPEVPWKAFALGAGLAALVLAARSLLGHEWQTAQPALGHAAFMLVAGLLAALAALLWAPLARLLTDRARRAAEVGQHARAMFFDRGLDRTRGRIGIMLLASVFEREIVLLADDGFEGKVDASDWQALTHRVGLLLRHGGPAAALHAGLDGLEALLLARGFRGDGGPNELPDPPIVQRRPS